MAEKFSELRAQMSPESRARVEVKAQAMLAEIPLYELRQGRRLSQKMLAEAVARFQDSVSNISKFSDL